MTPPPANTDPQRLERTRRRLKHAQEKLRLAQKAAEAVGLVPGTPKRVSTRDLALMLQLDAAGKTHRQIAAACGVSVDTVADRLADFGDSRHLAKQRLQAQADQLAVDVLQASQMAARRGDGSVSLELLDRLDVATKKHDTGDRGTRVMVVVGRSDPAAVPDFGPVVATLPSGT